MKNKNTHDWEANTQTDEAHGLEPRQKRFCDEYLIDMNASAAARRAGYADSCAASRGCHILAMPAAQAYIKKKQDKITTEINTKARYVTKELVDLILTPTEAFLDPSGNIKNLNEMPDKLRSAINIQTKLIQCEDKLTTITTYNLYNKMQMMEKLSKRLDPPKSKITTDNNNDDSIVTVHLGDGVREEI